MYFILAGDDNQARVCARIKNLDRDEWKRLGSDQDVRGRSFKGDTVLLFGSYRDRHMFQWGEWVTQAKKHGAVVEEVVDGRMR